MFGEAMYPICYCGSGKTPCGSSFQLQAAQSQRPTFVPRSRRRAKNPVHDLPRISFLIQDFDLQCAGRNADHAFQSGQEFLHDRYLRSLNLRNVKIHSLPACFEIVIVQNPKKSDRDTNDRHTLIFNSDVVKQHVNAGRASKHESAYSPEVFILLCSLFALSSQSRGRDAAALENFLGVLQCGKNPNGLVRRLLRAGNGAVRRLEIRLVSIGAGLLALKAIPGTDTMAPWPLGPCKRVGVGIGTSSFSRQRQTVSQPRKLSIMPWTIWPDTEPALSQDPERSRPTWAI